MYVIVEVGSSQYRVAEGDVIEVNRLAQDKNQDMVLDHVLLYADGKDVRIGRPFLKDVRVAARVVDHTLDDKNISFKFRRRKGYARRVGHRQKLTALSIAKIEAK